MREYGNFATDNGQPDSSNGELADVIKVASGYRRERNRVLAQVALFIAGNVGWAWSMDSNQHYEDEVAATALVRAEAQHEEIAPDETVQGEALQFTLYLEAQDDVPSTYVSEAEVKARKELLAYIDPETLARLQRSHQITSKYNEVVEETASDIEQEYPSRSWRTVAAFVLGWQGLGLYVIRAASDRVRKRPQRLLMQKRAAADTEARLMQQFVHEERPEWLQRVPSVGQLREEYEQYIPESYLPTVGAKFIRISPKGKSSWERVAPTVSAAFLSDILNKKATRATRPSLTQFTVQGQLGDEFKYAATALVLGNPMRIPDWSEPLYDAPWGSVAPMVHDGGSPNVHEVNTRWAGVEGRTDFIMRITPAQPDSFDQARLTEDLRFWQRAALALHCKQGTAPEAIDPSTRQALAEMWSDFEKGMQKMIAAMGAKDFDSVPWFLSKPRHLEGWVNARYEASPTPIWDRLNELEVARMKNPEFTEFARRATFELSAKVDALLTSTAEQQSA